MRDHSAPRTHARDTSYDSTLSSHRPHHVCIHIRVHFLHRVRTHRARGVPQDTFLGCPFTGTPFTASFSRYHVTRKSEWRRLRFPCSLLGVVAMSCPSPRLLVHPPVPRYVWRSPCFASSRRALGLEARACGVQRSPPRSTTCDRGRPSSSTRRGALAALGVQFLPTFPCGGLLRLLRR